MNHCDFTGEVCGKHILQCLLDFSGYIVCNSFMHQYFTQMDKLIEKGDVK